MAAPEPPPTGPADTDPSMEDVLASIRRILDDGEGAAPGPAHALPAGPGPALAAPPASASREPSPDGVFLLDQTMLIEEPPPMPPAEPSIAAPAPDTLPLDAGAPEEEPLVAASTAAAASASLGALVRVAAQRSPQLHHGGPTLEDMVRAEIRPLVKTWLDENLAPLVERLVRAEIERVSRTG